MRIATNEYNVKNKFKNPGCTYLVEFVEVVVEVRADPCVGVEEHEVDEHRNDASRVGVLGEEDQA